VRRTGLGGLVASAGREIGAAMAPVSTMANSEVPVSVRKSNIETVFQTDWS